MFIFIILLGIYMRRLVVGYVRLSVKDKSSSIANQICLIKEYCSKNNIILDKIYIDEGESGINFSRKSFLELKEDIQNNKIEKVIVKDISRLGRDMFESSYYISEFFKFYNVDFVSVEEDIDDIYVYIKSIINDIYVKDVSVKRKNVADMKTLNNEFLGPYPPLGYKIVKVDGRRTLEIDEFSSYLVKLIFNLRRKGLSCDDIASTLNRGVFIDSKASYAFCREIVWNARKVRDILKNVVYKGDLVIRKSFKMNYRDKKRKYISPKDYEIRENVFPSIIEKDFFDKVNHSFKKYNMNGKCKNKNDLENKVYCVNCSFYMRFYHRKRDGIQQDYFKCLKCNKTIFITRLKSIIDASFYSCFFSLDIEKKLNEEFYMYRERLVRKIEDNLADLENKLTVLYRERVKGNVDENQFISRKDVLSNYRQKMLYLKEYVKNYSVIYEDFFKDYIKPQNFIECILLGDNLEIHYNFKK